MPDVSATRATRRTSDHSLLISLGVCFLLILGYGVGLQVYGATTMADGVIANGTRVIAETLYPDGDTVSVVLPDGAVDDLNYVTDPADYRAPLEVQVWVQPPNGMQVNRLVIAVQDLDHLTGEKRRRLIGGGFGALVVLFVGSAVLLNRPRVRRRD